MLISSECPLDTGPKQSVSFFLVSLKKSSRGAAVLSVSGGEPGLLASQGEMKAQRVFRVVKQYCTIIVDTLHYIIHLSRFIELGGTRSEL